MMELDVPSERDQPMPQQGPTKADEQARVGKVGILIAGMHRSGTSALTRVLNLLGCDLPPSLMRATQDNERGYWEAPEIAALNDQILASAGSAWDDWKPVNPAWYDDPLQRTPLQERAIDILESFFSKSDLFLIKDPRIARLLPFWRDTLRAFGAEPRIVMPIREPIEVSASLHRRDGIVPALGQFLWLRHTLDAEHHTRDLPRVLVHYEDLLQDWRLLTRHVGEQLGIRWPHRLASVETEVDDFLSPKLRHHRAEEIERSGGELSLPWVKETMSILRGSEPPDEKSRRLDAIRNDFDHATKTFGRPIAELDGARLAAKARAAEAEEARAAAEQRAEIAEAARAAVEERAALVEAARDAAEQRAEKAESARAAVEERAAQAEAARAAAERRAREAEAARAQQAEAAKAVIDRLAAEVAFFRRKTDSAGWLLKRASGKLRYAPRDLSRKLRGKTRRMSPPPHRFDPAEATLGIDALPTPARSESTWHKLPALDAEMFSGAHWPAALQRPAASEAADFEDPEPKRCSYFTPDAILDPFECWKAFNGASRFRDEAIKDRIAEVRPTVKLSIVVPVYNPPLNALEDCIESAVRQTYHNYELILVDDHSTNKSVLEVLRRWAAKDERIKIHPREKNGHISIATNDGGALASGDFLVFLDNDDMLAKDALSLIALYIHENPAVDIVYTDDAKFDDGDQRLYGAKFKPEWSPELLLSYCYVSHVKAIRTSLYMQVGGCRTGFEGSQDHDLLLRAGEAARQIGHIPQLLYHRRVLPGSTAASGHAKPYSFEAGRRATEEAFSRRLVPCTVRQPDWAVERGYGVYVPAMLDSGPRVTLLIPTRNNWRSLDRLLRSLEKTTYDDYDILVIDNMSDDEESLRYLHDESISYVRIPNPSGTFNFASINNQAVERVSTEFVLFLNDDVEVRDQRWLSQMMGWARLPGVGAVGARLLFGDGRLQHGGVVTSLPRHVGRTAFRGLPERDMGYMLLAKVTRNCSAVTAACMLTRRDLFVRMGGFDAERFAVAYNDIDYCIRVRDAGFRIVYCGEAELYHHEGTSRSKTDALSEVAAYAQMHGRDRDPYYSPHLSQDTNKHDIKPTVVPAVTRHRPIRLLAFTHNLRIEGAPNSAYELLAGLNSDNRFDVTVISPSDGPLKATYIEAGLRTEVLDERYSINNYLDSYEDFCEALDALLNLRDYDLVYANTAELFWAVDAAQKLDIPSVWNIRESESWKTYYSRYPQKVAARALSCFYLPYRVVFVADSTKRRWAALNKMHNFEVVNNGIDRSRLGGRASEAERSAARRRLRIADEAVVILTVGTVSKRKGQHDLVQAIAQMPQSMLQNVCVLVVGARRSEYLDYLGSLLGSLPEQVSNRIRLFGETRETRDFWNAADIFVCTSRLESYPRVILEAMAHGLPIITTATFGVREQVHEGVNAVFYEPGDAVGLGDQLCRLVSNRQLRCSMGASSLQALDGLTSYDEMLEQYKEIMRSGAFSSVPNLEASSHRRAAGNSWLFDWRRRTSRV